MDLQSLIPRIFGLADEHLKIYVETPERVEYVLEDYGLQQRQQRM